MKNLIQKAIGIIKVITPSNNKYLELKNLKRRLFKIIYFKKIIRDNCLKVVIICYN